MASTKLIAIILLSSMSIVFASSLKDILRSPLLKPKPVMSNDLTIGDRVEGDSMIGSEVVWIPSLIEQTIYQERTFQGLKGSIISQVKVIDKDSDYWYPATAKVTGGGVGNATISISFTGEKSKGVYFLVELYGKIENCKKSH